MNNTMLLVSVLVLLGLSNPGYPDIMRCDTGRAVSSGNTTAEVLTLCGEPTQRDSKQECPRPRPDKSRAERQKPVPEANCVTVDTWTYNFGPRRFVQKLTFKNSRLDTIQTGGYGQ